MTDKKPGPVKPPIIDAKPRPSDKPAEEKPAPKPEEAAAEPSPAAAKPEAAKPDPAPKAEPPKADTLPSGPGAAPLLPLGPLVTAAGAGALIGLGLAYGLASFGFWPQADDSGALTAVETRAAQLENTLAARESETAEFAARLDTIEGQLAGIEAREPISTEGLAAQADFEALATQLTELSARVDAVAAGATGEEAAEVAATLTTLSGEIDTLAQRLDAVEPQIAEFDSIVARLDDLDARIADQADFEAVAAERDQLAQLPAALGALETAIAAGTPFAAPLAELEAILPALEIPEQARAAAATGATPPAELLARFRAAIPAILAARPQDGTAGWAETLLGQAASTLALRPTDGDSPQGLVGRTEAALASGDLENAQTAFASLPEPMRAAAPGFAEALAQSRAAQALLQSARAANPLASGAEAAQ